MGIFRLSRLLIVALVGVVGLALSPLPAAAQGPRLRPGLRTPERDDKERQTEGAARVEPANPEEAEEDSDSSPAAETYLKGVKALDKGETDAAIALLSRAIQLDPKYAPAYCDRGLALVIKGDLDKAVTDLNTAIRLAPAGAVVFQPGFRLLSERQIR